MLAHVKTVKTQAVVKLGKRSSIFILGCQRQARAVVLIECAEFPDERRFTLVLHS